MSPEDPPETSGEKPPADEVATQPPELREADKKKIRDALPPVRASGDPPNEIPSGDATLDLDLPPPASTPSDVPSWGSKPVVYDDATRRRIAYWLLFILTAVVLLAFAYLFVETNGDCNDCQMAQTSPGIPVLAVTTSGGLARLGGSFASASDGGLVVAAWGLADGGITTQPNAPAAGGLLAGVANAVTHPPSQAVANLVGLMTILFGPLITLIGTVMGFYYGGKSHSEPRA